MRDMYFNMKNMPESEYAAMVNRDDVDLVIVMGTVACKYFLEHEKKNKFMVLACADPIQSAKSRRVYAPNNRAGVHGKRLYIIFHAALR